MEDLKAKRMISTDHQFCASPPKKKKRDSAPELFLKRTGKIEDKKKIIPELNTSKGMKSILRLSQIPALLLSLGRVNREKLSPR